MSEPWSDWIWSERDQRYYCSRLNAQSGEREFQWSAPSTSAAAAGQVALAQQPQQQPHRHQHHQVYQNPPDPSAPRTPGGYSAQASSSTSRGSPERNREYTTDPSGAVYPQGNHGSQGHMDQHQEYYRWEEDHGYPDRIQSRGDRSGVATRHPTAHRRHSSSNYQTDVQTIPEDPEPAIPRQPVETIASQALEDREQLDPRFRRVAPHSQGSFFCLGRVFLMLWSEPAGGGGQPSARNRRSSQYTKVWLHGQVFSEIRRFVVIANRGLHSQCIPIQTYGRQATTKPGVRSSDHTQIYTLWQGSQPASPLEGERRYLTKQPIRMNPKNENSQQENLDPLSRINFAKTYTVEHNVRVLGIGKVHEDDLPLLVHYYKIVNEISAQ